MSVMFPAMLTGGFVMAKNRERQKENKKLHNQEKEESVPRKNEWGHTDLTPYNVVMAINKKEIAFR